MFIAVVLRLRHMQDGSKLALGQVVVLAQVADAAVVLVETWYLWNNI